MRSLCSAEISMTYVWSVFAVLVPLTCAQFPDTLWTCPQWGCAARGTFSLPTPVPTSPNIKWNWTEESIVYGDPNYQSPGCTTSLTTVACPTSKGYVSIHAKSGKESWTSKTNSSPYLPIVDMYGNVIKSDTEQYTFVIKNDKPQGTANLTKYDPKYGATMSITQTVLFTSSKTDGPQIVTYGWFGSKLASTSLKGEMNNISGTFLPCAHPLMNYDRAYIMSRFIPDNITIPGAQEVYGLKRLYALDLSGNSTANKIAWLIDLPKMNYSYDNTREFDENTLDDDYQKSYLAFFNNTIYINYMSSRDARHQDVKNQPVPMPPFFCAVRDLGNSSKLLFNTISTYGPMAIFDITLSVANITATGLRPVWLAFKKDQSYLAAYHPETGKGLAAYIVDEVVGLNHKSLGVITSEISITRQAEHPDRDVLVFGTQDDEGQAHLVAIEAGLPPVKPRLLWSINVSGPRRAPGRISQWTIGGQISSMLMVKGEKIQPGLVVNVVESLLWLNANQVYVRMIM